jgi:DNA-binding NarL/FixJ family response regulator
MKASATLEGAAGVEFIKRKVEDSFCIWLVDDDVCWCEHLTWLLNLQAGVNCSRYFTSPILMLIEFTQHAPPDAIVMDLEMSDMDGIETISAVRKLTSVPIIWVLTTFFDHKRRDEALAAGAADFFLKRNSSTQLIAAIHAASIRFCSSHHAHVHSPQ